MSNPWVTLLDPETIPQPTRNSSLLLFWRKKESKKMEEPGLTNQIPHQSSTASKYEARIWKLHELFQAPRL